MIEFHCSLCGQTLRVADEAAGKRGRCPQCGTNLRVPEPEMVILEAVGSPSIAPAVARAREVQVASQRPLAIAEPAARRHRRWVMIILVAAILAMPLKPVLPIWLGILMLSLCLLALLRPTRGMSNRLLRLYPNQKLRNTTRVAMCGLLGAILILGGSAGADYKAERAKIAAERAAAAAEKLRLAAEADERISARVHEAEAAWQEGNSKLANQKLTEAEGTPHATSLGPINRLRTRMANAEVASLLAKAVDALEKDNVGSAKYEIQKALAVPHADALEDARKLDAQIANATDPMRIRTAMMDLSDESFGRLRANREIPQQFTSGYKHLDSRIANLVHAQLADVAGEREQIRKDQLQQEQAAAEAARNADEQRKAQVAAAARAKAEAEAAEKARYEKGMGETLSIGYTSYVAWRAHWSDQLSSNPYLNERPNAKWLFVEVSVRNNDTKARLIPPFKLVDQRGREYESSARGSMVENAIGVLDSLNPEVIKQGYVVFDVPPQNTYQLKLSGGFWSSETGYIRLEPRQGQ